VARLESITALDRHAQGAVDQGLDVGPFPVPPTRRVQLVAIEVERDLREAFARRYVRVARVYIAFYEHNQAGSRAS